MAACTPVWRMAASTSRACRVLCRAGTRRGGPDGHWRFCAQHRRLAKPFAGTLATSAPPTAPDGDPCGTRRGGKIALQILHTGRYGYHPLCVAPSRIQSPISPFTPRELSARGIERQIRASSCAAPNWPAMPATTALRSWQRGLPDQPVFGHPHQPSSGRLGRDVRQPNALAVEIVRRIREAVGPDSHLHLPHQPDRPDPGWQHLERCWHWPAPSAWPAPPS